MVQLEQRSNDIGPALSILTQKMGQWELSYRQDGITAHLLYQARARLYPAKGCAWRVCQGDSVGQVVAKLISRLGLSIPRQSTEAVTHTTSILYGYGNLSQDRFGPPTLANLFQQIQKQGMGQWELTYHETRGAEPYVMSARGYPEKGVRWHRSGMSISPQEAARRLLQRLVFPTLPPI